MIDYRYQSAIWTEPEIRRLNLKKLLSEPEAHFPVQRQQAPVWGLFLWPLSKSWKQAMESQPQAGIRFSHAPHMMCRDTRNPCDCPAGTLAPRAVTGFQARTVGLKSGDAVLCLVCALLSPEPAIQLSDHGGFGLAMSDSPQSPPQMEPG